MIYFQNLQIWKRNVKADLFWRNHKGNIYLLKNNKSIVSLSFTLSRNSWHDKGEEQDLGWDFRFVLHIANPRINVLYDEPRQPVRW